MFCIKRCKYNFIMYKKEKYLNTLTWHHLIFLNIKWIKIPSNKSIITHKLYEHIKIPFIKINLDNIKIILVERKTMIQILSSFIYAPKTSIEYTPHSQFHPLDCFKLVKCFQSWKPVFIVHMIFMWIMFSNLYLFHFKHVESFDTFILILY